MATPAPAITAPFLPLEGGVNIRDMGGYATADGGRVKRGMLYRSGSMTWLTPGDEAHLAATGIRTVIDLRRQTERRHAPTRWHVAAGATYWSRDYEKVTGILSEILVSDDGTAEQMRNAMLALYVDLPIDHAESYRAMFQHLLAGEVPLLFNCSAGKDRTGVAGAFILHALGVDRETIVEDYLLTNAADLPAAFTRDRESRFAIIINTRPEVVAPLLGVERAYLQTMFDSLEVFGGIDAYLADQLGVDAQAKARLRTLLVE